MWRYLTNEILYFRLKEEEKKKKEEEKKQKEEEKKQKEEEKQKKEELIRLEKEKKDAEKKEKEEKKEQERKMKEDQKRQEEEKKKQEDEAMVCIYHIVIYIFIELWWTIDGTDIFVDLLSVSAAMLWCCQTFLFLAWRAD